MKKRMIALFIFFVMLLSGLTGRLAYIQVFNNEEYAAATARQQRIRLDGGDKRGTIYDRNREPLTGIYDEYVYIIKKDQLNEDAKKIFHSIGAYRVKNDSENYYVYRSKDYYPDKANELKNQHQAFIIQSGRRYGEEQIAVHLIGYINAMDGNGASGLEKDFNDILSKRNKTVYATADGKRMIIPGYGIWSTEDNVDCGVITTLDANIQRYAEKVLSHSNYDGSIIVSDAVTGEILASASKPTFNPNNIMDYLDSSNKEFMNQAIQSQYPPGSIFKIIVAAAALELGLVNTDTIFECKGYEEINDIKIKCSTGGEEGHGLISFRDAFAKSCNSAFIQAASLVGGENILGMAEKFGIGEKTSLDFPMEKTGILPDEADIQGAGIGNLAIGQGRLLVTPMQVNRLTEIIASGGMQQDFCLIKEIRDNGKVKPLSQLKRERVISDNTAEIINRLMVNTVDNGTANNLPKYEGFSIAGKTGSAEAAYYGKEVVHGWFTGFIPANAPKYVITVFVESGGSGRLSAVPLFQEMVDYLKN
ncbi:MAG: peptidoglycan D,D-transpeptidase FtsI family protein [Anaerovoracaceae bacterium]|jgi:penicillin-binding protein 2